MRCSGTSKKWLTHENYSGRSGKTKKTIKFSEESSRIILAKGNIELYDLGHVTRTVQCHSCRKHLPEGLAFCSCGVCLRPGEATKKGSQQYSNSTLLSCSNKSIKGQEAWRNSVATRSLESNGCQKRSMETWSGHFRNQVTRG